MVHVAVKRFFDFGWKDTDATLFQSGGQWAGCGRLFPIIEGVMEYELGPRLGWPDLAAGFHRELWRGEYDNDVASLAVALPSGLDSRGMSTRVKDMLKPLARTFMLLQAKPAVVLATPTEETEVTPATLGDPSVTDVTGALEASKGMSGEEKKDLAAKLTADARKCTCGICLQGVVRHGCTDPSGEARRPPGHGGLHEVHGDGTRRAPSPHHLHRCHNAAIAADRPQEPTTLPGAHG